VASTKTVMTVSRDPEVSRITWLREVVGPKRARNQTPPEGTWREREPDPTVKGMGFSGVEPWARAAGLRPTKNKMMQLPAIQLRTRRRGEACRGEA
jgi:hypothetical protein